MKKAIIHTLAAIVCLGTTALLAESSDPVLVVGNLPEYPAPARVKNVEGTVIVEALVDESGKVFAADVVQSVHQDLDKAALKAVLAWQFAPAKKDGVPVMKVVQIPVDFHLVDPLGESILHSSDTAIAKK